MRRQIAIALALLLAGSVQAQAEELIFDGTVTAVEAHCIIAPAGGTISDIALREGQWVSAGETVTHVEPTRIFSPLDGTVRGMRAQCGDSAAQTLFSIAPTSKFTITASVEKAYESVQTQYVTVGERLYICCAKDGTHRAEGVVVAAQGMNYTVETDKGELYMEETVYLYRGGDYDATACVGSGTVSRTAAIEISATGSVLALYVAEGEEVERGQLLFETVEGAFASGQAIDTTVSVPQDGVIAEICVKAGDTIAQGETIATMYVPADFRVQIAIPEEWVSRIQPGATAQIVLYADAEERRCLEGVVSEISLLKDEATDEVTYSAYIDFAEKDAVRLGMTTAVTIETGI